MLGNHKPYKIEPFMGKGMKGKFDVLSWQIEAGHVINLAVLKHAWDVGEIKREQFNDLVNKRIEYLQIKKEEARISGNLERLAQLSAQLEEFPQ